MASGNYFYVFFKYLRIKPKVRRWRDVMEGQVEIFSIFAR